MERLSSKHPVVSSIIINVLIMVLDGYKANDTRKHSSQFIQGYVPKRGHQGDIRSYKNRP